MKLNAEQLGDRLERGLSVIENVLEEIVAATADKARDANRQSSAWLSRKERDATRVNREVKRALSRNHRKLSKHADAAVTTADRFVTSHRWAVVGVTAATAMLLGFLFARR